MRRILYIVAIVFGLFFMFTDSNVAKAQYMSKEMLDHFWEEAGDSEYYYAEPCDVCGEFIGGTSKNEFSRNMKNHKIFKHPDLSGGDNPGFTWDSEPLYDYDWDNGEDYIYVVSVSDVAWVMKQELQICDYDWFIDEFSAYNTNGYIGKGKNVVSVNDMANFICSRFRLNSRLNLVEASEQHKQFMIFVKPSSGSAHIRYLDNRSCLFFDILTYVSEGIIYLPQYLFIFD